MINGTEPLLEAHLFDFDGDIYGRRIDVEFVAKLRDEQKFADLDAMVRQIDRDAAEAHEILNVAQTSRRPGESRDPVLGSTDQETGFRPSPE